MGENTNEKNKNKKKTEKNNNKPDNTNKNSNKNNSKNNSNNKTNKTTNAATTTNNNNKTTNAATNNSNNKSNKTTNAATNNSNNKSNKTTNAATTTNNNNKSNKTTNAATTTNNNKSNKTTNAATNNNNNKSNKMTNAANNNNKTNKMTNAANNNNKTNKMTNATTNNSNNKTNKNNKKKNTKCTKACLTGVKYLSYLFLITIFLTHALLPTLFWIFPEISNFLIFSNRVKWPLLVNLSDPHSFGLNSTRSFFLKPKRYIQLGVWHILPENLKRSGRDFTDRQYDESLQNSEKPIVMYMHGNSGSRATSHRLQLYNRFSEMNFHTITFDYRGFGDSTGIPFEDGVVDDSLFVYNWIKSKVSPNTPVILWGHSLGTGIATRLAKILCDGGEPPIAVILESPFNNILEASANLPPFFLYRQFKPLSYMILNSVERCGSEFASDQNIKDVTSPILIIHAEDDGFIPIKLARKLYNAGLESRPKDSGRLQLVPFEKSRGYGHKHLHSAPNLVTVINSFLMSST